MNNQPPRPSPPSSPSRPSPPAPPTVFRSWAPGWLITTALLAVVLPGVVLFALSTSNVNAAAGFYGVSPNDVQYSLIILYGSMASFIVLEGRFFKNIASKEYLIGGAVLLISSCFVCYTTRSFAVILVMRYLQGLLTCGTINITLTLMFTRLHSARSREIAYSVVYCILLCVIPLTTLITAGIIDTFNYNVIYKAAIYSYLLGAILMFLIMDQVRLNKRIPLYQLDWSSFIIYSTALCLIGYILIYGQQYEWLEDRRIRLSLGAIALLATLFILRQLSARRPYIHLNAFKNPKFIVGAILLFVFYIIRGAFSITTTFISTVLGRDPIHIGTLLTANVAGIIVSVIIASRLILAKRPSRLIFIYGFGILLIFHVWMSFLFTTQVDTNDLIIPLILQGLGAGMLMVPIILFVVSAAPPNTGSTGSAIGIFIRFLGFCTSIALINFCQLWGQHDHLDRFKNEISQLDGAVLLRLDNYQKTLVSHGMTPDAAAKVSSALLNKTMLTQAQLKFSVDYYHIISWALVGLILIIALFPSAKPLPLKIDAGQPAPVTF